MAHNGCSTKENWKKEANEAVSIIDRLMERGKDDLMQVIVQGECYDDLEDLIREAMRMKSLLLEAENTFATEKVIEKRRMIY